MSHHTAPVAVRQQFMVTSSQQRELLARMRHASHVHGFMILATCNRIEFYATVESVSPEMAADLLDRLLEKVGYPMRKSAAHQFRCYGEGVAEHMARVAAGLDSVVLGEAEVLGQLKQALQQAEAAGVVDARLRALAQFALKAGRRARAETDLSKNPVSVSSVAVRMAERHLGTLEGKTVVIVGLGETGNLAVKAIQSRSIGRLILINRTFEKAEAQAPGLDAEAVPIFALPQALAEADVVFTATGCPYVLMHKPMLAAALAKRPERPLVVLDMAVPPDADPKAAALPGLRLITIDQLEEEAASSLSKRRAAVPQAERILAQELDRWSMQQQQQQVQPLITDLRRQAEQIRRHELERLLKHCPEMDEATQQHVQRFSQALVQKLLHHPTTRLRSEARGGDPEVYAEALRSLFAL
ncbi:MAG: glutamyl-tRNA reductase [Bacteroidota bacterium]